MARIVTGRRETIARIPRPRRRRLNETIRGLLAGALRPRRPRRRSRPTVKLIVPWAAGAITTTSSGRSAAAAKARGETVFIAKGGAPRGQGAKEAKEAPADGDSYTRFTAYIHSTTTPASRT